MKKKDGLDLKNALKEILMADANNMIVVKNVWKRKKTVSDYISKSAFIEDVKTEIVNIAMNGLKGTPRPREELYQLIERIEQQPTVDEKEIIRKAFERVVERLDKQAGEFIDLSHRELNNNSISAIKYLNKGFGVARAIKIVKEECGISE